MAALGGKKWTRTVWSGEGLRIMRWESWDNEHCTVMEGELVTDGPLRDPDEIVVQEVDPTDPKGRWRYMPASKEEADSLVGTRKRYHYRRHPTAPPGGGEVLE
jgi:hypothetical protein